MRADRMARALPALALAACVLLLPLLPLPLQSPAVRTLRIPASGEALVNPFVGWVSWAMNPPEQDSLPHTLTFAVIPWSMVESQEGEFDFSAWEQSVHFDTLGGGPVRFILRPVLDYPRDEAHMDIPRWLYDKLLREEGDAGQRYSTAYGQGLSPNYASPALIEAHGRFLAALGTRYNENPAVAFIQLGSVGHWGEWHVDCDSGLTRLPPSTVTDQYVRHYIDAFPDKLLLMRRPFPIAGAEGLGLYDDSFLEDTQLWLDWIEHGYTSDETGEWLPAMPDYWKGAPAGGEFATGTLDPAHFSPYRATRMIEQAHLSFLGPYCPLNWVWVNGDRGLTSKQKKAEKAMRLALGYRLRVDELSMPAALEAQTPFTIQFVWKNDGSAPFYYPWPIRLSIRDSAGGIVWADTDWDIRTIYPGEDHKLFWRCEGLPPGTYQLGVAVFDPDSNEPGVRLAQLWGDPSLNYQLAELEIA